MALTSRFRDRRLILPTVACLLIAILLVTTRSAGAAASYNISNQQNTVGQALGIGPNGAKVCAVWSQFDVESPQIFVRIYTTATQTWNPPTNAAPFQVSSAGNTNKPRCVIDSAGNTHVVWNEKNGTQQNVAWRMLPAGGDPNNGGNWSGIQTVETNRDVVDIDAFEPAQDGKVWLVYRYFAEEQLIFRNWTPTSGWSGPIAHGTNGSVNDPRIAVDNNGYVHVVFKNGGGNGINYFFLYPNGAEGQQTPVPNGTSAGDTDIAVDRVTGDVHIVYVKDYTSVFYARKSYNGGFSLNQIASGSIQIDNPGIAWSAAGRLLVVFNNNAGQEIDLMTSENGGGNWSSPSAFFSGGRVANPWLVADATGQGYVAFNASFDRATVYFTTVANAIAAPSPSLPPGVISGVNITPNTLTSFTVNWTSENKGDSRVYFGTSEAVDTTCTQEAVCTIGNTTQTTEHHVTVRNTPGASIILPNTKYYYRVLSSNNIGQTLSDTYSYTTPSLEIVGRHKVSDATYQRAHSYNGHFSALVAVPAAATKKEWTTDNVTFHEFAGTATTTPTVVAFSGDVTTTDPSVAKTYTLTVRFTINTQTVVTTNGDLLDYNPSFKTPFSDVSTTSTSPFAIAIYELAGRGIVQGSGGLFRPTEPIVRAEAAALIARALGWDGEYGDSDFSDQGAVDNGLWNDVRVLSDYNVARGFGDGTFHPNENVTQAQVISLVTRAMVAKGYWQYQPDSNPNLFPEVPSTSGHRVDLATYTFYIPALTQYFVGSLWDQPSDRRSAARGAWDVFQYVENLP